MFNLNPQSELTLYATFLFFVTNYMCTNNSMSSDIMKMLSIKNKDNLQMICLLIFAVAFYFISDGMVHRKRTEQFRVGGQQNTVDELLATCEGGSCVI
jgi:hypothetical protein